MVKKYAPDRGDVIWIDFAPVVGHEQGGLRPAFVISPRSYNSTAGLLLACPITSRGKGYPFEVQCRVAETDGVILSNHIRSLDWKARRARYMGAVAPGVVADVQQRLLALIRG